MADATEWTAPAELNAPAGSGIVAAVLAALPAVQGGVNATREAAYNQLLIAVSDLRRLLVNIDPQSDAAVLTAVTAALATL